MTENTGAIRASFQIPLDHPALPGHFPGNPIVPGVVVVSHVIRILEAAGLSPTRLRNLKSVKFIEPLLPGQNAFVTFTASDAAVSFSVSSGGRTITKGSFGVGGVIGR